MLLIQCALAGWGFYMQHREADADSLFPQDRNILPLYISVIALEWLLVWLVLRGLRAKGMGLWDIMGGRWRNWKDVAVDVAFCIPFLFAWQGAARLMHHLLGPTESKSIASLLPRNALEIVIWIAVSISAGICEEVVFRGYFQKQFAAYTRSMIAAVMLQGIVFGIAHAYQGVQLVVIISILGMLYGWFAAWRRNLRANMMAHGWTDIWSGWLSGVLR
jgi:uncharacterized protein